MPRKNNKQKVKSERFEIQLSSSKKKRYTSRIEAEKAADYLMAMDFSLELKVYQDLDGGWYLTKKI
jgi:hypothetical protein